MKKEIVKSHASVNEKNSQKVKYNERKTLPFIILWIVFLALVFCRVSVRVDAWIVLTIVTTILSLVILIKNKMPSKKYVIISFIFMILATVAYLGVQLNPFILIYGLKAGIGTFFSSLAVFSVMETNGGYKMVSNENKNSFGVSICIAVITGAVLSVINTFLSGQEINFDFSILKLLVCLNPAIFEEMACRAIFMAYCIYFAGNNKMKRFEVITMYFMMCMPHTLVHGYGLIETLILCVLFGIPFTILQRKRDIVSAMLSHGLVDAVRFTLVGF